MAENAPIALAAEASRRFLTFRVADRLYALPAEDIAEVIRTPQVARLPHSPPGLMGVANLRGVVLPVASLRGLMGQATGEATARSRALVLAGDNPLALAVDAVDALVSVDLVEIETTQAMMATEPGERLSGAFKQAGAADVAKILDVKGMLAAAFVQRPRAQAPFRAGSLALADKEVLQHEGDARDKLVTFQVGGQEFALGLETVREVISAPNDLVLVPRSEALVLGVMGYRDTLLPLLSLHGLLGVPAGVLDQSRKVVVTTVGGALVGLVVDRMRAILPVDPTLVEPIPAVLAARMGGEARIKAIYRGEGGRRLISILVPDELFREEVMRHLGQTAETGPSGAALEQTEGEGVKFLVFRLGDSEFGLPIEVIDEVAQVPDQITKIPKTPAFLEGVVNLRGDVLPVVDQRRRFDMAPLESSAGRRLIVVRTERHRAGLIVDSVSQVLGAAADAVEPAPDLTGEAVRLVQGVINLEDDRRMILVLDPSELLSRAERGLLDAFQDNDGQAAL